MKPWSTVLSELLAELTPGQAERLRYVIGEAQASEHHVGRHQGLSEGYSRGYGECMRDWETSR